MYDVFSSCKLLSYYKYTCDTISVSASSGLLHAITRQGIETYTVRMYAAASDWIRANAPVDVKADQQLVDEKSLTDEEERSVNVMRENKQSCQDSESENAVQFSIGCNAETESISSTAAVSTKSAESVDIMSDHEISEDVNEEVHSDSAIGETEGSRSSSDTDLSNIEVESPVKNTVQSESELSHESSQGSKGGSSSPSDVKLTVDNSGRTLVRFTSGSTKPSSPVTPRKGAQFEDSYDSESSHEFTASQRTRAFAVVNPLSRNSSSGAKLNDTASQATVNKLSSDCGWTLPVFELENLRQVGG